MKYELSILIPARNEMFLKNTIDDLLVNKGTKTEILVGLDGQWAEPTLQQHPDVTVVYYPESIGQRAITNRLCKLSNAKYVMKVDAHCAFDKDFDTKLLTNMNDDWTVVPIMRNLHVFDWVCQCGHRIYQGPTPKKCEKCSRKMEREIVWIAKQSPQSTAYRFDKTLHFQYWGEYKEKQIGDLVETMSLQGSCFMMTRKKYLELDICDESWGSWGNQGTEVALRTWLSGGRVLVNKKTWYAHLFRTQGGDFSFPYPQSGRQVERARQCSRDLFLNDKWDKAIHPLSWLIKKFNPPEWENGNKGIIYYTDHCLKVKISKKCQNQIQKAGIPIVSISLKPMPHFGKNIHIPLQRGYLTMFKQILVGLEASDAEIIFFCEHDVLYHPNHFDFIPPEKNVYYYNLNVYKWKYPEDHFLKVDDCKQTSGLCAYRELLIGHYRRRIAKILRNQADLIEKGELIKNDGFSRHMGFEPGCHTPPRGIDNYKAEGWESKYPNIDIRHENNFTPNRWTKEEFRNPKYTEGWMEIKNIPCWGKIRI